MGVQADTNHVFTVTYDEYMEKAAENDARRIGLGTRYLTAFGCPKTRQGSPQHHHGEGLSCVGRARLGLKKPTFFRFGAGVARWGGFVT